MSNALNFSLGLNAAPFLSGLNGAHTGLHRFTSGVGVSIRQLAALAGVTLGVREAFQASTGAVARGDQLYDLSIRTGASVQALYKLQEGFKQIGLGADSAVPMIMKLQRALGSPEGQAALSAMGLSGRTLSGMDAAGQIEAVAAALGEMGTNSQAAAAYRLLGREGAASMLQIARSGGELSEAMRQVARDSEVWARNAERFGVMADLITALKSKLQTFFAGIIGGITPAVQRLLDYLNSVDVGAFGERIGNGLSTVLEIFTSGQATTLIRLSLMAAFEAATNGLAILLAGVMVGLRAGIIGMLFGGEAVTGAALAQRISDSVRAGLTDAGNMPVTGPAFDALTAFLDSFSNPAGPRVPVRPRPDEPPAEPWQRPTTSLEKMGFIMDGGGNAPLDFARRTAKATEKMAEKLSKPLRFEGNFGAVIINE